MAYPAEEQRVSGANLNFPQENKYLVQINKVEVNPLICSIR